MHFTMLTYVLTICVAKQERKAHMVASTMITVACASRNIACVYYVRIF